MKSKFTGTWVMTAFVALLAAYTAYEYRNASRDLDQAQGEQFAFTVKREEINEVRLTSKGESTVLRKEGDKWSVVEPVQDEAESNAIEGFLFQTLSQKLKRFRAPEDGAPILKDYGLDPIGSSIELGTPKLKEKIEVGTKNAFDGSFYVKTGEQVYTADPGLAQVSERPASNFRSRRLWRAEGAKVLSANLQMEGKSFSLTKENDTWVMQPAPDFKLDHEKVDAWIEKIQDFLPSEFEKEEITNEDKRTFLLAKPSAVVTFKYKDASGKDGEWTLTIGQERAEDVFMFTNQRPTIYKSTKVAVDRLKVAPAYFRDGKAPFRFEVEKAREVRVKTSKFSHVFKKNGADWTVVDADKDLELDQEKLVQLFQNIRTLEAQEFVATGTGIKGQPQVEIRGENGELQFQLAWGDEYKAKSLWNSGLTLRFVKTNLSKEIAGVAKDKLEKMIDESLLRKKAPEKK